MSLFIIFFFGNLLRIGNLAHAKKLTNSMSTLNRGGGVEGVGKRVWLNLSRVSWDQPGQQTRTDNGSLLLWWNKCHHNGIVGGILWWNKTWHNGIVGEIFWRKRLGEKAGESKKGLCQLAVDGDDTEQVILAEHHVYQKCKVSQNSLAEVKEI